MCKPCPCTSWRGVSWFWPKSSVAAAMQGCAHAGKGLISTSRRQKSWLELRPKPDRGCDSSWLGRDTAICCNMIFYGRDPHALCVLTLSSALGIFVASRMKWQCMQVVSLCFWVYPWYCSSASEGFAFSTLGYVWVQWHQGLADKSVINKGFSLLSPWVTSSVEFGGCLF